MSGIIELTEMNETILKIIDQEFKLDERKLVVTELASITLNHVMVTSETNLYNTRIAILKLAKGDLNEVINLTKSAKIDFRDVILWATQQKKTK